MRVKRLPGVRRKLLTVLCLSMPLAAGACSAGDGESLGEQTQELCSGTVLAANPPGPSAAGTPVTLSASGGSCASGETPEYKFQFKREGTADPYTVIRGYGTSPTTAWSTTGLLPGKYLLMVFTRAVGSTASFQHVGYLNYLIKDVCTSGTLTASPSSPQSIGTPVTLTASGSCTGGSPEFRYFYRRSDQSAYTEIAPYTTGSAVWNTAGLSSGSYSLLTYVRAVGNASTYEGLAYATFLLGSVCTSASLTAGPTSPQQPGTLVTLTGSASCGASTPEYRFYYRGASDAAYVALGPFGTSPSTGWDTTGFSPGTYSLMVQARAQGNSSGAEAIGYANYKLGFTALGLSAGSRHTCVLLNSGIKCFGRNLLGAPTGQYSYDRGLEASDLGDNLPEANLGGGIKSLTNGAYHACAILGDDSVRCWGANGGGGLGLGDTNHRSGGANELGARLPKVNLGTGRTARGIAAGGGFTCAILDDGSVKCWGANTYGNLGLGDTNNRGDEPGEMGDALPRVPLGTGRTATQIFAGVAHVCAILDDASVKCWGLNNWGQLGLGDVNYRGDQPAEMGDSLPAVNLGTGHFAKRLSLGAYHTCALLEDDSLKCWGQNANGAIGSGDTAARGDGPGEMGDNLPTVSLASSGTAVKDFAAGGIHTCAVLADGRVKCWGSNVEAMLGVGDLNNRGDDPNEMGDNLPAVNLGTGRTATRVFATYINSCAELDNGQIKCWGAPYSGMIGIGPTDRRGDAPSDMGDALPGFALSSTQCTTGFASGLSYHYGCMLLANGSAKCWGSNSYGQLGIDRSSNVGDESGDTGTRLSYVSLGKSALPVSVGAGEYHSCALLADGRVKCWGANLWGTSGLGDTRRHDGRPSYMGDNLNAVDLGAGRTAKKLYVGSDHSCAILDNDMVKCWGRNDVGQLGLGDRNDRGDDAGEMGDALPAVSLGTGRIALSLSLGYRHTCALLDNSTLKCWGWGRFGQLGNGSSADRGDGPGEMGDSLPTVNVGTGRTVTSVVAGYQDTCAVLDDQTLKCWGDNSHGQLGLGDKILHGPTAASMGDGLPVVNLGTGRTVRELGLGFLHTCALLDDQSVKCWGYNAYGKLGYGDTADRGDGPGEMGDNLPAVDLGGQLVSALGVGWDHNCVVTAGGGGAVRCWGYGDTGSLGMGDNLTRGDQPGEMGLSLGAVNLGDP
jgi:alpha-tubulin suppressor-like RCC1 family protein